MSIELPAVADRIPLPTGDDCVLVGVDGLDGAGKTTFADALATAVRDAGRPAVRISVDDFHHVRSIRYRRGRDSAQGFWLESFDYARLARDVLDPFGPGGSRRYSPRGHDLAADRVLDPEWRIAAPGTVVLVDGLFLHRRELRSRWAFSVYLDVPRDERERRMLRRDGGLGPVRRYRGAGRIYLRECDPRALASLVIDHCA